MDDFTKRREEKARYDRQTYYFGLVRRNWIMV